MNVATEVVPPLLLSLALHGMLVGTLHWIRPVCGDGVVSGQEQCDDSNVEEGDGCSPICEIEPICGNGVLEGEEKCDDGNLKYGDGCTPQCTVEVQVEPPPEPPRARRARARRARARRARARGASAAARRTATAAPQEKAQAKKQEPPPSAAPPPAPAIELPANQTIGVGNSGVTVGAGTQTRIVGDGKGKVGGDPKGKRGGKGNTPGGTGDAPKGPPKGGWEPTSELYVTKQPRKLKNVIIPCPAVQEMGISGTVVLKVQVRKNGTVRRVRVVKKMGNGCDEVAVKALKKTKFAPAIRQDGKPTDYEIARYEYEFRPPR